MTERRGPEWPTWVMLLIALAAGATMAAMIAVGLDAAGGGNG